MQNKIFFFFICSIVFIQAEILKDTQQVIVVVNEKMNSSKAKLYLLDKAEGQWKNYNSWDVVIGRNGLGWGRGDFQLPSENVVKKKEGDGKSPAGIFKVRPTLYGYSEKPPQGTKLEYIQVNRDWLGIDDTRSKYYNKIVDATKIKNPDWDSFEYLKRKDHLYRWVLVVEHNTEEIQQGAGSCIFIHLWRSPNATTSGCTAMTESNILNLIQWLDPQKKPKIIQLPRRLYNACSNKLGLPLVSEENIKEEKDK